MRLRGYRRQELPASGTKAVAMRAFVTVAASLAILALATIETRAEADSVLLRLWPRAVIQPEQPPALSFGYDGCEAQPALCDVFSFSCPAKAAPAIVLEYRGVGIGSVAFAAMIQGSAVGGQVIRSGRTSLKLGLVLGKRIEDEMPASWAIVWQADHPDEIQTLLRLFRNADDIRTSFQSTVSKKAVSMRFERTSQSDGKDLLTTFADSCAVEFAEE